MSHAYTFYTSLGGGSFLGIVIWWVMGRYQRTSSHPVIRDPYTPVERRETFTQLLELGAPERWRRQGEVRALRQWDSEHAGRPSPFPDLPQFPGFLR